MSLYAIGDLHFATSVDKPMDVFGKNWENHEEKICDDWRSKVKEEDTVLVLGDTSWGTGMDEAKSDLDLIHSLPGKKIFIKGNHDYWWGTVTKMNKMYDDMKFINTNFYNYEDIAICGGRGWICPNDYKFNEQDERIYKREGIRIEMSIKAAVKAGYEKIIVMTHYPPTNDSFDQSIFTDLYEKYGIKRVYYGHLHGDDSFEMGFKGERNGVTYNLVSADYVDFKLTKIED